MRLWLNFTFALPIPPRRMSFFVTTAGARTEAPSATAALAAPVVPAVPTSSPVPSASRPRLRGPASPSSRPSSTPATASPSSRPSATPATAEEIMARTGLVPLPRLRQLPHPAGPRERLFDQIQAGPLEDPGPGGWSGGFANQAHWDPSRPRDWRCWAQSGPTWSAHCGAEVAANDTLGLCQRHRRSLLDGDLDDASPLAAERVLSAG